MRILLVDQDAAFVRAAKKTLFVRGFAVDLISTLDEAETALSCASYHILLLELALPDGNGLDWLKQLRREGYSMPAMMMSSLSDLETRIAIFNGGADDFLPKPVSIDELIARMRAILRRSTQLTAPVITFGNLHFDPIGRQVSVDGRPLRIARREVCILEHLLSRAGRTVPRALLEESLYAFDDEVSTNALEVGIYRLRTHLSKSGTTLRIKTARGVGYALELKNDPLPCRHT
ncbi:MULTISPECIES: response regulator [Bradyrhizobium]|uniref:DNA-binding response regulator n=3 Tax=Bradyrhizobium TaxID=374 RepID=A0AAE6CC99_9BRAD|nr:MULTISPECIES: response regulator transcription factor [Bradyrhizobium]MCG2632861.1 response regulator transcription factor [Bradyrhizobium zhengyangense]MCG2645474.1 response regulator transcription factor [Bradyrhizobium zhengyangense]MCG2673033.1 response regulator transcription factor [Bradyrhizobium zhengyangense]MDN4984440.1 response regulator transcription factor [Bradyrhizobium sp. WYCCWR 13022]MDN5002433.1 response regulator transcription factor [Bradyrhizobium sp. WYCCWR 12677]